MLRLPENGSAYPPENHKHIFRVYEEHNAWHTGDPAVLRKTYADVPQDYRPRRYMFWTRKGATELQIDRHQLHVPLAGDIAQTSADLLFSEPPNFVINNGEMSESDNQNTQMNLDDLLRTCGLKNKLLEAGETCSALGGVFLRLVWNTNFMKNPTIQVVSPDRAIATFMYGQLVAVAYVTEYESPDGQNVMRHIEHHEDGYIHHALYEGTKSNIGTRVSLDRLAETADLEDEIRLPFDSLASVYVPNQRPLRRLKGYEYGRSDYDGIEGLFDAIDEAYTSWMRDVRLGKSRIIVPTEYLERRGRGRGASFDIDAEVFTGLEIDPNTENKGIQPVQFEIRHEQHKTTVMELIDRAVTAAGYSPQSFGINIEGRAESGTALKLRERKSFTTQGKKQRYWTQPLEEIIEKLQILDVEIFSKQYKPIKPRIEWQDAVQQDVRESATVIESLHRAQAASLETKVRLLNPELTEEEVQEEVLKIATNFNLADQNVTDILELP
jgi:A118 family predicted phage portal protein